MVVVAAAVKSRIAEWTGGVVQNAAGRIYFEMPDSRCAHQVERICLLRHGGDGLHERTLDHPDGGTLHL